MKVAVVMTVKNEARLLRQNVLYHLGIGMERIFVYFDNTTDNGREQLRGISKVVTSKSVDENTYSNLNYLKKFWSNAREHHTARQCLNTYDALQKCKSLDIKWLISLDADELFLTSITGSITVKDFFEIADDEKVDIVSLCPLEVICRKMAYSKVMLEETFFKTKKNFKSRFDEIYHRLYDPYNKSYRQVPYWLGHTMGKSAIRVNSSIVPYNVHRYTTVKGDTPLSLNTGFVLHYHMYDFKDFIKKFRNFKDHPDHFLSGNKIEDLKRHWIRLVNDKNNSEEFLKHYFKENLLYDSVKLKRLKKTRFFNILKRKEPAVVEIRLPKEVLGQTLLE